MSSSERPLSPHLQVYRWRVSMFTSIAHRASGVFLSLGAPVLVGWLIAAAASPEYFDYINGLLGSMLGKLALLGWTLAFFYHIANGVRHLFWDIGAGFEKPVYRTTAWLAIAFAIGATAYVWAPIFMGGAA
ncbi:MAG: succinate dehydrogenase, cytochrome b556 subunit [Gammaproteobacteria bacterium]|nr:succinate dehydrogenase, cytochrome b556 subunit [Gammaproteobacteria bacterium]